ncbi:MAG TPA: glutaredoxin family protein [Terriglobia bacterium]|nr:glutaredoxin family protein [Terriglobia bacterium]
MPSPIRVEIYSRPGCHLCDDAKEVILRFRKRYPMELSVIDIDRDPELAAAYDVAIPVVFLNGEEAFRYRVDERELEKKLRELSRG